MNELAIKMAIETTTSCQLVQNFLVCAVETSRLHKLKSFGLVGRHSKLYCLCSLDIQNFIVCAVTIFKTLLFVQSRHSKLYCLCSRDIQNFIVCAVATFKTLLFVQSRHSKLYCLCNRDIQNFIVCAVETFETLSLLHTSDVSTSAIARTFTLEHKRRKQGGLYLALTIALTFCCFTLEDF